MNNKDLLKWLFISIGIFCVSFVFLFWINKVNEKNYWPEDIYYLDEVSQEGENAYLDVLGYNCKFIYVYTESEEYSYYVYLDEMNNAFVLKLTDVEYRMCVNKEANNYISCYIEGGAYPLNQELEEKILDSLKDSEYYSHIQSVGLYDIYLDTELYIYEDTESIKMLYDISFFGGIIGILISLFLLVKNNISIFKKNKEMICKWIFRLSFMPLGIIIMISMVVGFNEGFEMFLLYLLLLSILLVIIPVLPIALIYQVIYIILYYKKKQKNKIDDMSTRV